MLVLFTTGRGRRQYGPWHMGVYAKEGIDAHIAHLLAPPVLAAAAFCFDLM